MATQHVYLVTFNLWRTGRAALADLEEELTRGQWAHWFDHVWFVVREEAPDDYARRIHELLHPRDFCFVVEMTEAVVSGWLPDDGWTWLQKHLKDRTGVAHAEP